MSVQDVVGRARVSRRTFYNLFTDVDTCFSVALHRGHERIVEAARIGYVEAGEVSWEARVRGSVVEVLTLCEAHPSLARICLAQDASGPADLLAAQHGLVDVLTGALLRTAQRCGIRRQVPDRAARALVQGCMAMVREQLAAQRDVEPSPSLISLTGEVMFVVAGPFAGPAAALQQLHLPVAGPVRDWSAPLPAPASAEAVAPPDGSVWEGPRERILRYVAEHPGASNLTVGAHIESNESTTSRRLARLARDGLIVSRKRGRHHSWHLTDGGSHALAEMLEAERHGAGVTATR